MAPGADDRGTDGLRSHTVLPPAQPAFPDAFSQSRPQIPEFQPGSVPGDTVGNAPGKGEGQLFLPGSRKRQRRGAPGGKGRKKRIRLPQPRRHFQRPGQHLAYFYCPFPGKVLPHPEVRQAVQHGRNIGNFPCFCQLHQPSAHIQAPGRGDFPLPDQGQIAGSPADVHVEHRFPGLGAVAFRAAPLGGQGAFQIRPRRRHHKISCQVRNLSQHRPGILFPAGLSRDNDGAGIHILPPQARFFVFLPDEFSQSRGIHPVCVQQGRKMHRTAVQDLPVGNGQLRHGKGRRLIFNGQLRHNHLGGGSADVQPHACQLFSHGPPPPPESAG